ncbi:MAG: ABC transporter permease [Actinobacteria bacterium]|nr:ABC transporter permease [Actinomycetota bacterium]
MKARHVVALVARRDVVERARTRTFRISTAVMTLAAAAAVLVPHAVAGGPTTYDVGLVGAPSEPLAAALAAAGGRGTGTRVRVVRPPDQGAAEAALRRGSLDLAVVDGARLVARRRPPDELVGLAERAVALARARQRLGQSGIPPAEADALLAPRPLPVRELEPLPAAATANKGVAFASVLFLYILLLSYGGTVAAGAIEEKASRVSEVLLGTMAPHQLLAGKIIGIGLLGVAQVVAVVLAAAGAAAAVGSSLHVPAGAPLTFAAAAMWFLLGYAFYSCAYAAAGAAASRPEEVGSATMPLNLFLIASYLLAVNSLSAPDGAVVRVLSFLPPTAPLTMLPRAALGTVAPWEVPLSAALMLGATYALVRLAGRVYAGGLRTTGRRLKLKEAWRAAGT